VLPPSSAADWDKFLVRQPEAHLLQSSAWGRLKTAFGWSAHWVIAGEAGAQVLVRQLAPAMRIAYIPMGPVGAWLPDLVPALLAFARRQRCFVLKLNPTPPTAHRSSIRCARSDSSPACTPSSRAAR